MLSVKYFCAGRLVDAKGGCSRVREADKWVRLQELVPVHPLLPTQTAPAAAAETDSELEDTDSDVEEHSSSAATTTIRTSSHHENGLWRDQQRLDGSAGWDTDLEPETESDQSTSPERESRHDPDELWDRYCNLGKSTMGLQFLPLPAGLTLVKDQVERIGEARGFNTEEFEETSRTKPYQARYFNADKYRQEIAATTGGGDHHRYGYDRHAGTSSEQQHSRMSRDTNSGPKMNERLAEFRSRLHELYSMSPDAPAGSKISETLKELEARLSRWRESRGRLHEHKKELCEDGLDNPALRCRCCNEGLLTRANVPCYHLVMCDECIHKHGRCVICNTAIESTRRTYWG
ncbi:hypothetical protein BGX31_010918 [Mortierella sp. GBA43]|nr:hypothetical protein BGX31_010918 [Mortierella sp. GBA43]